MAISKQYWILGLLLIILKAIIATQCPYFKCDPMIDYCMDTSSIPIRLNPCSDVSTSCSTSTGQCVTNPKKLPGRRVTSASDCLSGKMNSDSFCEGRGVGEACDVSSGLYCSVGYYCSPSNICTAVKKEGEACSALNECATYLLCNLGMADSTCKMPYSFPVATLGYHTAIAQICSTGRFDTGTYMCKSPTNFAAGTSMINGISNNIENLCVYEDGTILNGECMYFSQDPTATVFCQPYDNTYVEKLADIKTYMEGKPECSEGLLSVFCEQAIEKVGACKAKKALEGIAYGQIIKEKYYPSCWEKEYTCIANLFLCDAFRPTLGILFVLIALLLF